MALSQIKIDSGLKDAINKAVAEIGGWNVFITPGERVFLKPNYNTADPFPASTESDFLRAVTELVCEHGARKVIIGDSSTVSARTRKVMTERGAFGMENLGLPVKVVVFEEGEWMKVEIKNGKFLKKTCLPKILDEADKLILLPCLKTHFIARYTGALKLSVGFMKPLDRLPFHAGHVEEKIAELNTIINPDLIIMDARKCFITRGPMDGEVREPNQILASDSRVEIDLAGVNIIKSFPGNTLSDVEAKELKQIKMAIQLGVK